MPNYAGTVDFDMFTGYITVGKPAANLFYWFVESQNNPATDPVVLWLNGGPGCASTAGFLYEHGPWKFPGPLNGDGTNMTLVSNPYSWNKVANVLYIDSPSGVGLSYPIPELSNDAITANNTYHFLLRFFSELFPEFRHHDFFISGESYGGHYVPQLAYQILQHNPAGDGHINMKGILVGNGVTTIYSLFEYSLEYLLGHAMISYAEYDAVDKVCKGNFYNSTDHSCNDEVARLLNSIGDINGLAIYEPCAQGPQSMQCVSARQANAYLNDPSVRDALKISPDSATWNWCNDVNYADDLGIDVGLLYPKLWAAGYRIIVYSGDATTNVNSVGTQKWVYSLNRPIKEQYRPWYYDEPTQGKQVGGYYVRFDTLEFITIKGAGHMVPQFRPQPALVFFENFIKDRSPQ